MNTRILNEEIEKIKKLSGILNEAGSPTAWVSEFLGIIKAGVKRMPDDLLKSDEIKEMVAKNKITLTAAKGIATIDWAKLSVDEIMVLFKWDHILNSFKELISKNKIDVSDAAVLTYKGTFKKIAEAFNNVKETAMDSFKKGFKVDQAPGVLARFIGRNIPVPYLRGFLRSYIKKLTPDEIKKLHGWFWLGVGDFKSIKDSMQKAGFPGAVMNFAGQSFKKWAFWTGVFTASNVVLSLIKDFNEDQPLYESDLEWIAVRGKESFEAAGIHWIFPALVVWNEVVSPLGMGGGKSIVVGKYRTYLEAKKSTAEREADALERMKKSTVPEKSPSSTKQQNPYTY